MEILLLIITLVISGVLFGALGRLVVPGPNPMGMGATILAGLAGSLLGTIVGVLLQIPRPNWLIYFLLQDQPAESPAALIRFLLAVILGAAVLYAVSRRARPDADSVPVRKTILAAVGGALVGGLAGVLLRAGDTLLLLLEILGAATGVYAVQRRRNSSW
jgi:uncharacterized membrane protein YeaQ/YmgE (transglycosylase-associated protein family)